jgi:hypothetical protein
MREPQQRHGAGFQRIFISAAYQSLPMLDFFLPSVEDDLPAHLATMRRQNEIDWLVVRVQ